MTPQTTAATAPSNLFDGLEEMDSDAAEAMLLSEDLEAGRLDVVRTRCAQILERNPNASLPHRVLGVVAARAGDAAEAERRFEAAIAGVPAHREPYENLARLLVGRARFEEALDALARLAGAFPGPLTFAEAQIAAEARLGVGDVEGALEATLDALDLEPESESALRSFGFVLDRTTATQPSERYRRAVYKLATHRELLSRSDHMAACFLVAQAIQDLGEEQPRYSDLSPEIRELLRAVLFNRFVPVLSVEKLLIGLRAQILKKVAGSETGEGVSEELLDLAEAMARHSYTTEYLWEETAEETAQLEILRGRVEARLAEGAPVAARDLFTLGAYRDLSKIDAVRAWVAALAEQDPHSVDPTLELLVFNPIAEAMIAPALPAVTEIEDGVSSAVRAQYEANPYPRWRIVRQSHPTPYLDHIRSVIQPNRTALSPTSDAPKVLIAGCGTGQHPISAARGYRDSTVLAVDLSRASLAYAARQAIALGVGNIRFAQADILKLPETDVRFDVVEAGGVIHHMRDPEEGLRALLSVLKPGGYLKLGLYSRIARRDVSRARAFIAERGYASDLEGIRAFRRDYLAGAMDEIGDFTASRDFYHTSDLRDLVFHVQEHQLTLPEIAGMLERNGLTFLGFSDLNPSVRASYAEETPDDESQTDLAAWHAFEERHPRTFVAMYQFWSRKA